MKTNIASVSAWVYALTFGFLLYLNYLVLRGGYVLLAVALLAVLALAGYVFAAKRAYAYRYVFPSLLAFALFVILPLGYTVYIAFTNYSAINLMTYGEVRETLIRQKEVNANRPWKFSVHPVGPAQYVLALRPPETDTDLQPLITKPFKVPVHQATSLDVAPGNLHTLPDPLTLREVIPLRHTLTHLKISEPATGAALRLYSFRAFVPTLTIWQSVEDSGEMRHVVSDMTIIPDFKSGFFRDEQGAVVGPGFRVPIGWANFTQIATNEAIRGPFLTIFAWTLSFAFLSVILTFVVGFLLAILLEWKPLRGRHIWRSLVILPYAVPAFISILIFRGLFNPQFGEINEVLNVLFGIRPEWTTNVNLARTMVVLVNIWLGYPYMMILCTGILQSVPGDIYEASSIDGGSPVSDLYRMTLPLILPPLKPLLIASFAFNFNNFLLVQLLTGGSPRIPDAATAVGYTDILVTYTFNLAFRDSGANFGFASAIATLIFIIVSILSYVNLKVATREKRAY